MIYRLRRLRRSFLIALTITLWSAIFFSIFGASVAYAQGPTQPNDAAKVFAILQLVLDTLQGKPTVGADVLYEQAKNAAIQLGASDLFFFDFGNPNLPFNQFAATLARNLLALTPLYALGYLIILVIGIWKERPIPNPIVYAALVAGVIIFLASFAIITQGLGELGRTIVWAIGGNGTAMFARGALLDTIIRILITLQKNGGILSILALVASLVFTIVILIQLTYRGLSMAIWRLVGILLIPLSVLLETTHPQTAGKVIAGFFEAWLDMVGKMTLLLLVLALASAESLAKYVWLVLPAGLLLVTFSWMFLKPLFTMIRDAFARAWKNLAPASNREPSASISSAAEAARAREIDEERKRLLEE
jgi:hypothetical protein